MKERFLKFTYSFVIELPKKYDIFDFSMGYESAQNKYTLPYGIGKYNEKRPNMYTSELYKDKRDIHMGIDIKAPVGTKIMSFYHGEIFSFAYNSAELDYGYTIITKHNLDGLIVFALYGHLSKDSISDKKAGQKIKKGEVIAFIGDKKDNGGWMPHLHFQLSFKEPKTCDMPGVVSESDLEEALNIYPDPQWVLGKLY